MIAQSMEAYSRAELIARAQQGCRRSMEAAIEANTGLVVLMARKYARRDPTVFEELMSAGRWGLWDAVKRYDARKGAFASYALRWIKARILAWLLNSSHCTKIATTQVERAALYLAEKHAEPGDGTPLGEIAAAMKGRASLDPKRGSKDAALIDSLSAPDDVVGELVGLEEETERRTALAAALDGLGERERYIVEQHLLTEDRLTLVEIGEQLGISNERARQIELVAVGKIAAALGSGRHARKILDAYADILVAENNPPTLYAERQDFLNGLRAQIAGIRKSHPKKARREIRRRAVAG